MSLVLPDFIKGAPFTAETAPLVPHQIDAFAKKLCSCGIERVLAGLEMEFVLPPCPASGDKYWERVKSRRLQELDCEIANAEQEEKGDLKAKKKALQDFNAREILIYDLLEDDRCGRKSLEPLFGASSGGSGYYDAPDVLELKVAYGDVHELLEKKEAVLQALAAKITAFGFSLDTPPSYHVNLSFWKDGKNLFEPSHPEFPTTGKAIVEGITRALYDVSPMLLGNVLAKNATKEFDYSLNRVSWARSANGRYEIRFGGAGGKEQDPDLITAVALAGAVYGLETTERQAILPAKIQTSPTIRCKSEEFKTLSHILANASVDKEGNLTISNDYLRVRMADAAYELGVLPQRPSEDMSLISMVFEMPFARPVYEFLNGIRVDTKANKIIWPANDFGQKAYSKVVPEGGLDYLPAEMQRRIRNGTLVPIEEILPFVPLGGRFPDREHKLIIDVNRLNKEITFAGVSERLIVSPGYDMATPDPGLSIFETRLRRMHNSAPLSTYFSPELITKLREAIRWSAERPPRDISVSRVCKGLFRRIGL